MGGCHITTIGRDLTRSTHTKLGIDHQFVLVETSFKCSQSLRWHQVILFPVLRYREKNEPCPFREGACELEEQCQIDPVMVIGQHPSL